MQDPIVLGTWAGVVVAAALGVVGWVMAARANGRSDQANRIAEDALEVARSAEDRADRLERLARERADIWWHVEWITETATLTARNMGTDMAHDVEVHVDTDLEGFPRRQVSLPTVAPTETIEIGLLLEQEEARARFDRLTQTQLIKLEFAANVAITWRTPEGASGSRTNQVDCSAKRIRRRRT